MHGRVRQVLTEFRAEVLHPVPPTQLLVELARGAQRARVMCDTRASDYRIAWLAGTADDPAGGGFGGGGWKSDT